MKTIILLALSLGAFAGGQNNNCAVKFELCAKECRGKLEVIEDLEEKEYISKMFGKWRNEKESMSFVDKILHKKKYQKTSEYFQYQFTNEDSEADVIVRMKWDPNNVREVQPMLYVYDYDVEVIDYAGNIVETRQVYGYGPGSAFLSMVKEQGICPQD